MKKWIHIALVALLGALLCLAAMQLFSSGEPAYQRRPLGGWLERIPFTGIDVLSFEAPPHHWSDDDERPGPKSGISSPPEDRPRSRC